MAVEDITSDWLTQALQQRYPGVEVKTATVKNVIWGSATKVLVDMTYNDAGVTAGLPSVMYVKGGFNPELLAMVGTSYITEAIFYGIVAPQLDVPLPQAFYSGFDRKSRQAIILMEDLTLRGATFNTPITPLTPEQVAEGLALQAGWHARWWNSMELVEQGWLSKGNPGLREVMNHLLTQEHWDQHLSMPKANPIRGDLRDRSKVRAAFERLWQYDDACVPCFIHGDTHIGNTYLENGKLRFLDWQTVMIGPWAHDVATFLSGALKPEDRRAHEKELLKQYLDQLKQRGANPPDFNDAWNDYVRHILHGFLWVMTPEEMQPDAYVAAMTERYAVAAEELGTMQALR
jgi:thiamine kinase-like enzyme